MWYLVYGLAIRPLMSLLFAGQASCFLFLLLLIRLDKAVSAQH